MPIETQVDEIKLEASETPIQLSPVDAPVEISVSEESLEVNPGETSVSLSAPVTETRVIEIGNIIQPRYEHEGGTAVIPISAEQWVLSAGFYYQDIEHNLESMNAVILRTYTAEGQDVIAYEKTENFTSNKIRVWVPADPDGRFTGTAVILGVSE